MEAFKVDIRLAAPVLVDSEYPIHLDALLAYACVQEMEQAGEEDCWAQAEGHMGSLLERTSGENWVWKASQLLFSYASPLIFTNMIRRCDPEMYFEDMYYPDLEKNEGDVSLANPNGVWVSGVTKDGLPRLPAPETFNINSVSGQQRGYQWLAASRWVESITAYGVGDADIVQEYLTAHIQHIGKAGRNGHGRVKSIRVTPHDDDQAWRVRVLPEGEAFAPNVEYAKVQACVRGVYWRKTDRIMAYEPIV